MSDTAGAAALELSADNDADSLLPLQPAVAVPLTTAQLLGLHGGLFAALLIWSIMHIVVYVCIHVFRALGLKQLTPTAFDSLPLPLTARYPCARAATRAC
jgi:hypothetical protein